MLCNLGFAEPEFQCLARFHRRRDYAAAPFAIGSVDGEGGGAGILEQIAGGNTGAAERGIPTARHGFQPPIDDAIAHGAQQALLPVGNRIRPLDPGAIARNADPFGQGRVDIDVAFASSGDIDWAGFRLDRAGCGAPIAEPVP